MPLAMPVTAAVPFQPDRNATSPFARVEVHATADPVLDAWAELEAVAPCSVYQTRAWLLPWIDTLGRRGGFAPLFTLARAADGTANALLCLGIVRRGPLKIATWLGGKDANFNLALVRPGIGCTEHSLTRLLRDAARACGGAAPDAFLLANQPRVWRGEANPLALLTHQASPSAAYGTGLPRDAESLFAAHLSKETRKKLRKKEAKLATFGALTHRIAAESAEQTEILDAFLAQKTARFRAQGIESEFETPEMRAFIEAASAPRGRGIELHALRAGERTVAVYGGGAHHGTWSGMFNSFDADEEIAKCSPGDLLLMRVMAKACADGLDRFDLGIGEARYKAALCPETIALFDVLAPVTLKGRLWVGWIAAWQRVKRAVKQDARLFALAKKARAAVRNLRA